MNNFVYDAAVLVAADRNVRRAWAEHKARLELGLIPLVPALVVVALRNRAAILTGDTSDIERLIAASGREATVVSV